MTVSFKLKRFFFVLFVWLVVCVILPYRLTPDGPFS